MFLTPFFDRVVTPMRAAHYKAISKDHDEEK